MAKRRPRRRGVSLHVMIPPALRDLLQQLVTRNSTSITIEVIRALEASLRRAGLLADQ